MVGAGTLARAGRGVTTRRWRLPIVDTAHWEYRGHKVGFKKAGIKYKTLDKIKSGLVFSVYLSSKVKSQYLLYYTTIIKRLICAN